MRKPASCILENKDSDQLRSYINASVFAIYIIQSLCFLNIYPKLSSVTVQLGLYLTWLETPKKGVRS